MLMIFATVALVGCTVFGVRDRVLHDRGRDADCQITSFTEKMVNVEGEFHDEIPLTAPASDNIVEQVTEYFTPGNAKVAETAQN